MQDTLLGFSSKNAAWWAAMAGAETQNTSCNCFSRSSCAARARCRGRGGLGICICKLTYVTKLQRIFCIASSICTQCTALMTCHDKRVARMLGGPSLATNSNSSRIVRNFANSYFTQTDKDFLPKHTAWYHCTFTRLLNSMCIHICEY